jgi:putative transposase
MAQEKPARKPYPSELTDAPWTIVEPRLPAAHTQRGGRPREADRRELVPTLGSLHRSGGHGARLPPDVLPQSPVDDDVARWRDDGTWVPRLEALRAQSRRQAGRESPPRVAGSDRPAVKTTARGGRERGDAGGTKVTGRQRPRWVATLGWLRVVVRPRAGREAGVAAPKRLQLSAPHDVPRRDTRGADNTSPQQALHTWRAAHRPPWRSAGKTRPDGVTGGTPREKRGVGARTTAWNGRERRHSQDDERHPEASAAMISMRTRHLMRRRLTSHCRPAFHDRSVTADSLKWAS